MKPSARFILENARVTRVSKRDKVTLLTIAVFKTRGDGSIYYDASLFDRDLAVAEGDCVTVTGELERYKPKDSEKWLTTLTVKSIAAAPEDQCPPMPTPRTSNGPAPKQDAPSEDNIPF
jgi:hypothetical protein